MVPGRRDHRRDDRLARRGARAGRHDHRRRQHATTTTTSDTRPSSARRASTTSTSGTSGGVWGFERGFCLMIGGEDGVVDRLEPDLRLDRARRRRRAADARADRRPTPGGARATALRAERRRPLREDGAQRDRVRADGGVRRGAEHHQERRCGQAAARDWTPRPPRSRTRSTTSTRSTRPRSPRCGGAGAWSARGCWT